MNDINEKVNVRLSLMSDEKYRKFQTSLIPSVTPAGKIIGVRTPVLRKFATTFGKTSDAVDFIQALPHSCYEANNLHAFLIEQIKDFKQCVEALNIFLPYVDNWATCDMMSPKILKTNLSELLCCIDHWLRSEHTYEIRFGIISLMRYYLDESFDISVLNKVMEVKSQEYYVNMARAWFFAEALINHYDEVYAMLQGNVLDKFTHNKTIQKAVESYRINTEKKNMLRQLKRK